MKTNEETNSPKNRRDFFGIGTDLRSVRGCYQKYQKLIEISDDEISDDEKKWVHMITKTSEEILMEKVLSINNEIYKKTLNGANYIVINNYIDDTDILAKSSKYRSIDDDWEISADEE